MAAARVPGQSPTGGAAEADGTVVAGRQETPTAHGHGRAELVAQLVNRLAAADRYGAMTWTRDLLRTGVAPRELRAVIGAAQTHVGARWQSGRWSIAQEHVATGVVESVIGVLDDAVAAASISRPHDAPGSVVVTAAEGELHALPVRLAEQALRDIGVEVVYLGAMMPASDLDRTLPLLQVDALAVSVTCASNLPGAARTVAAGRDAKLPVLLGGRASTEQRARALGATGQAQDVEDGARLLARWLRDGAPPTPEPSVDESVAAGLRAQEHGLVDAATEAFAERWPTLALAPEQTHRWVTEDLASLLEHTAAAVLLGERELLLDQVLWLTEVSAGRGLPADFVTGYVESLHDVLGGHPEATEVVGAVRRMELPTRIPDRPDHGWTETATFGTARR